MNSVYQPLFLSLQIWNDHFCNKSYESRHGHSLMCFFFSTLKINLIVWFEGLCRYTSQRNYQYTVHVLVSCSGDTGIVWANHRFDGNSKTNYCQKYFGDIFLQSEDISTYSRPIKSNTNEKTTTYLYIIIIVYLKYRAKKWT